MARSNAASSATLTNRGNKAYAAADYQKALKLYQQAAEREKGDSSLIDYDRGNALYRLQDFEGARKAYEKAAHNLKDGELAARSYYNLGNAAFRQGEALGQQAPDKAMAAFADSATAYREALRLTPQFPGAGANLELANRKIKELAALVQKQPAGAGRQDKSAEQNGQEKAKRSQSLHDLANRQKQLAERTEKLQNAPQSEEPRQKAAEALSGDQRQLRQQTEAKQQQDGGTQGKLTDDLKSASALQRKAEDKLRNNNLEQAAELQKKAAEKLASAAKEEDRQQTDKSKEDERQQQIGDRQEKKPAGEPGKGQDDNRVATGKDSDQAAPPPELDPREILNQEKIQRQLRRQRMLSSGTRQAEKDW